MATGPSSPATPATAASYPRPLPPPLRGADDRRLLLFHMAEPHRSHTPAPRQPSPAGFGAAWFTPVQQPPRLPPAAARLQHGLSPAAAAACSPSTTPAASARYAPAPRTCSQMWPKLMAGAKDGGADCIETYVFSNGQETSPGKYYFKERFDLVQFATVVKDAGLYLMLRIGLFVPAEWNFGGVPTMVFRTDNEPFKSHMDEGAAAGDDYVHFPLKLASNLYLGSVWRRIEWTVIMYSISLKIRTGSIWKNGCFM